jgi:catechol 2,3-dioxygenase-like lactoylglutathione lyase family enzyme
MLDHVSITVSDLAAAERFYDAIMTVLGASSRSAVATIG